MFLILVIRADNYWSWREVVVGQAEERVWRLTRNQRYLSQKCKYFRSNNSEPTHSCSYVFMKMKHLRLEAFSLVPASKKIPASYGAFHVAFVHFMSFYIAIVSFFFFPWMLFLFLLLSFVCCCRFYNSLSFLLVLVFLRRLSVVMSFVPCPFVSSFFFYLEKCFIFHLRIKK